MLLDGATEPAKDFDMRLAIGGVEDQHLGIPCDHHFAVTCAST